MSERPESADTANEQDAPAASEQTETVDRSTETPATEPDSATVEIELPIENDVLTAVKLLEDAFGTVTVRSVSDSGASNETATLYTETLTGKQLEALRAAYHSGYFERPRERSATEIADSLGVSHSTFLRHLRAAEAKVFAGQFE